MRDAAIEYGTLKVTKTVTGDTNSTTYDANSIAFSVNVSFDTAGMYGVKRPGETTFTNVNFSAGIAGTFFLKAGESVEFNNIPTTVTYNVTEYEPSTAGYSKVGIDNASAKIAKTGSTATVNNKYTVGGLNITKAITVNGTGTASDTEEFEVKVKLTDTTITGTHGDFTFTNGEATAKIKNGQTLSVEDIPTKVGYTVTESDLSADQTKAGYVKGTITNSTGSISETAAEVTVNNTYTEPKFGSLQISKTVDTGNDPAPAGLADKEFTATITLSDTTINETYSGVAFTDGVATVTLKNGDTKTIEGIPEGVTATVEESDPSAAFTNYTFDTSSTTKVENLTISSSAVAKADLVNKYTQDKGKIKLVKTIEGPVNYTDLQGLMFTVTNEAGTLVGEYNLGRNFTDNNGQRELTLEVPVGTTYNVVETLYDIDSSMICTVSYAIGENGTFAKGDTVNGISVTKGDTTTVTYKNAYQQKHTVKISKAEIVDGPEIEGAKLKLTKNTVDGEVVKEWTSTSTPTEFELTEGTYVLTETLLPDEYHVQAESVTFKVDANGGITITEGSTQAGKANAEVSSTDAKKLVMIDDLGGILRITVQEEDTNRLVPGAEVKVTTVKPDGTKETKTYTTDSEGKIRITNLPASNEYSYEVTKVPEGYKVTTDGSKTAVAVEKGKETKELEKIKPKDVTPADDTKTGTLIITVLDEQTKQPVPNATVTVKNPDGTTNTYTTDENGKITITKLPAGDYKITVTKVPDGYTVTTGKEETATVEVGKTTEHTALIGTKTTPGTTPSSTPNQTTPGTTPNPKAPDQPAKTTVNTGDRVFVIPVIVLMVLSLIALVVIIIRKRKMRKEY